jgi:hypothetical protein
VPTPGLGGGSPSLSLIAEKSYPLKMSPYWPKQAEKRVDLYETVPQSEVARQTVPPTRSCQNFERLRIAPSCHNPQIII